MGEEEKMWNAVIRQALIAGYLSKDVENYGLLKVTPEGHKFLKKPNPSRLLKIMISRRRKKKLRFGEVLLVQ